MPYDKSYDPNTLDTGLPDDFEGTIANAIWEFDPQIENGTKLVLNFDIVDTSDPDIDDVNIKAKAGKDYETLDGGATATREDGKLKPFHNQSAMGLMVKSLVESGVDMREICEKKDAMPNEAAMWNGLRAHWNRHEFKGTFDGAESTWQRLLPTKLIDMGVNGSTSKPKANAGTTASAPAASATAAPAKAASKSVSKSAAAPVASGTVRVSGVDISQEMYDQLFAVAYEAENVEAYQDAGLAIAGDNTEAMVVVLETDDASLWGQAVAKWKADNGQ